MERQASRSASSKAQPKNGRRTLVEQQKDVGVRDPSGFAEMKIRHLDKDAHKMRQRYKEVERQMEADAKEIGHIDAQIANLKSKYDVVIEHLEHRVAERDRVLKSLEQAKELQTAIMGETKNTVWKNVRDEQANMKRHARGELQAARGYGSERGTTFTKEQYLSRTAKLRALAGAQSAATLPSLPGAGATLAARGAVISRSAATLR
mmetsp:Transcript_22148/g.34793  ORF Transcript_22148/g.34793 Transcript_22148/m.34793 type:complete len:206 (-) Transcript_22148:139-756(-)